MAEKTDLETAGPMKERSRTIIGRSPADIPITDLDSAVWDAAAEIDVTRYWSGETAPDGRHFTVRLLWTDRALYVRFAAKQTEPPVVSDAPVTDKKTVGLWDRDVCEIFIAPDKREPKHYFEFEAAPTGEWIDIAIDLTSGERGSDLDLDSGMETASRIEPGRVVTVMKIPFAAFGAAPVAGDVWLGNVFRCVGKGPARGYLAWQPTFTEMPNFHVPDAFGEFLFG